MTDTPEIKVNDLDDAFVMEYTGVAPFPTEKFLTFLSHLKVQSKDFGLVPFKMLGSQRYLLREIEAGLAEGVTTFVILKARQLGISSFFLALDMYWAFAHKGLLGVFITHKEEARDDFRSTVEVFFAETPAKYRINYVRHNRNLLILKNASKFRYLIAGTGESRKGGLGRGGAANFVHATECAFYGNGDDLAEFRSQTSSLYPHRLQIYETTANGFNHFNDMWEIAKEDPTKRAIFIGWWRDERNQLPVAHPFFEHYMPDGIRTALLPLERKRVRLVREQYNYEISLQQIAWYRWHLATEKDGDQSMMDQEFPWTEEDAFQATGSKFFTVESITDCMKVAKKVPFHTFRYKLGMRFEETDLRQVKDPRAPLRIYEDASRYGYYALGCDPAYGSSDEADRTVISIWRCYADCIVQVAEYCSTEPSTYQCAWVLAHLAGYYGVTFLMPILEMNGPGQAVFDELEKVRKMASEIRAHDENYHLKNILGNMRHYFYSRIDSLSSSLVYQWKCLALDTRLPTPDGWTTMNDVKVGDRLLDEKGSPCNVTGVSPVYLHNKCYRVCFDDGTHIVANDEHLWSVTTKAWKGESRILKTSELVAEKHCIPVTEPLELDDKSLPIDPYVLGVWLGDGESNGARYFSGEQDHEEIAEALLARGARLGIEHKHKGLYSRSITGLRSELVRNLLLGNKHIPEEYLRGSFDQRLSLLQGLMDTDGTVGGNGQSQCSFTTTSPRLRDGFLELLRSLGIKAKFFERNRVIKYAGEKSVCSPAYQFYFTGYPGMPVFGLARKKARVVAGKTRTIRSKAHRIVAVEPIESVPVKCVAVDSPSHLYLAGDGMVPTHNTTHDLKTRAMNQFKNGIELGRIIPRSLPLLEEMRRIENDQGVIAAAGAGKDDRVMAAALAYQAYNSWIQTKVKALGLTLAKSNMIEEKGGTPPTERVIQNYLKRMQISVPT